MRDFQREREVIANVRRRAEAVGLDPGIAEQVMKLLIESSLTTQEQDRVRLAGQGGGRRALVFGGNGRMGRWFVRFLAAQGFDVEVADPTGAPEGVAGRDDWKDGALDQDLIVVAAPRRRSNEILLGLAERKPKALVFDIGSLKTPHHHERFDGSGYPDRLGGDAIPRTSRIFSVVDVFDALTSERPYKKPMPLGEALDIIERDSGRQFDPIVVAAFLGITPDRLARAVHASGTDLRQEMRLLLARYFRTTATH